MSNAMSLKANIRNIAKQKNIPAQIILQNYRKQFAYAAHIEYSQIMNVLRTLAA